MITASPTQQPLPVPAAFGFNAIQLMVNKSDATGEETNTNGFRFGTL